MLISNIHALSLCLAIGKLLDTKMGAKSALAFATNYKAILPIAAQYEADRFALLERHALKDERGNAVVANDEYTIEDVDRFNAAANALALTEVEVPLLTVSVEDCSADMSPAEIGALMPMLEVSL